MKEEMKEAIEAHGSIIRVMNKTRKELLAHIA